MPTPADATATATQPPTCELRDWLVFRNGHHKPGEFYSPADVRQIAVNFEALRGHLTPTAGLGHDLKQRLTASLGLPNVGEMSAPGDVRADDQGNLYLTVRNVPTWLGGQINAGRYRAGSVELKRDVPDPTDAAKKLPGSVLTAVALLGEEEPAVKGCPPPRAVFADGTEVPPSNDPLPVPAGVTAPADPSDTRLSAATLCFSEGAAVNRDEINQKLIAAGLDPAAVQAMADDEAQAAADFTAKYGDHIGKKFAADNPPEPKPPEAKMSDDKGKDDAEFAARFSSLLSDALAPITQRMGAMEAAIGESQKAAQASMSTMSAVEKAHQAGRVARVEQAVEQAWLGRKIDPAEKARLLDEGKALATRSTFAAGDSGELDAWLVKLAKLPVHPFARDMIVDTPADAKPGPVAARLGANGQAILRGLKQDAPRAFKRLTEAAA